MERWEIAVLFVILIFIGVGVVLSELDLGVIARELRSIREKMDKK